MVEGLAEDLEISRKLRKDIHSICSFT
jgi:hypothetical protein